MELVPLEIYATGLEFTFVILGIVAVILYAYKAFIHKRVKAWLLREKYRLCVKWADQFGLKLVKLVEKAGALYIENQETGALFRIGKNK